MNLSSNQRRPVRQESRLERLQAIAGNQSLANLDIDRVRRLDRSFAHRWGIDFHANGDLELLLPRTSTDPDVHAYWDAHDRVTAAYGTSRVSAANQALYNCIARGAILGPVTSQRRAMLIDATAVTIALVEALEIRGPILDVGCHAGFVASLLADEVSNAIVGIDPCAAAIEFGRTHPAMNPRVELIAAGVPWRTNRLFELVLAVSAMPQDRMELPGFLRSIGDVLMPGGIAVLVSMNWIDADVDRVRAQLKASGLGFGYADVVGGYEGLPPKFETEGLVVLVKGTANPFPRKIRSLMEVDWQAFREYANLPGTPAREKTQAFCRSGEASGH